MFIVFFLCGFVKKKLCNLCVQFGNTSSPYLLDATVKFQLRSCFHSPVAKELQENLYVDD